MARYVALLRGINLGKRRLSMQRLAELFEELKFSDVSTYIASGNVLFSTRSSDEPKLAAKIEKHLVSSLGYEVDTFLRTDKELAQVVQRNPFTGRMDETADARVNVSFFRDNVPEEVANTLTTVETDNDTMYVAGRELYWFCKTKMSESVYWTLPEVKRLKMPSNTMRNMNTVEKLAALAAG